VRCEFHGESEIFARMSDPRPFRCALAGCGLPLTQVFHPATVPHARIEISGEDSTDPRRVRDGTAGFNVGLPPIDTPVGTRADGKPKLSTRPVTHNELGTRRGTLEYAKRHGLEPIEKRGAYRPLGVERRSA
jgi:hypothetical protein